MWYVHVYVCVAMCSAVSDADGDAVRCRWAEAAQGECGDVCQTFPATLDQVLYVYHHHLTKTSSSCNYLLIVTCFEVHGNAPI